MLASTRQYTFSILFLMASALIISVAVYSMNVAHRIADVHAPLVDASMEIQLELTKAHLLFEELMVGDNHIDMQQVLQHIKEAQWFIHAMAWGAKKDGMTYVPLDDGAFNHRILRLGEAIKILASLMDKRLSHQQTSLPGSRADEQFNGHYEAILFDAERMKQHLMQLISEERETQKVSNYVGLALLIILLIGVLYYNIMQRGRELLLIKQLKEMATHDELTLLHNRRSFNKVFNNAWYNALRAKTPLTIAICDIDFFKKYNDTLGHQAGDMCLQQVAQVLQGILKRETDFVARYGGEEFVFILPVTYAEGARWFMDKLHKHVAEAKIKHPASDVSQYVTLSIGIATCTPNSKEKCILIEAADKALYQAKAQGRNRTVLASS